MQIAVKIIIMEYKSMSIKMRNGLERFCQGQGQAQAHLHPFHTPGGPGFGRRILTKIYGAVPNTSFDFEVWLIGWATCFSFYFLSFFFFF